MENEQIKRTSAFTNASHNLFIFVAEMEEIGMGFFDQYVVLFTLHDIFHILHFAISIEQLR